MSEEMYSELEVEAEERGESVSAYIREILENRDTEGVFTENTQANTSLVECHSCGYEWEYKGDMPRATCPACGNKVYVK